MRYFNQILEFSRYIRTETCLFVSGIALSGYLLFNKPGILMLPLMLTAFFSSAAIYSYNHITDKKEDAVNNRKINRFAENRYGKLVPLACICISFMFSIFLSSFSFVIYIISLSAGMLYSALRLKKLYFFKNFYTGIIFSLVFLMGEIATGNVIYLMFDYLLIPFLSGFILNLLGDIRGYKGDKHAGLKTFPILLGLEKAKTLLQIILWCFIILIFLKYRIFASIAIFMVFLSLFLLKDDMKITRVCILLSFATLPAFMLVALWI